MITPAEVFAINTELDQTIDITPHIEAAEQFIDDVCGNLGYSTDKLHIIKKWTATHFATLNDPRLTFEGLGDIQASYQHKEDLGFDLTPFGAMAKRLDTKGAIARLEESQKKGAATPAIIYLGGKVNDAWGDN